MKKILKSKKILLKILLTIGLLLFALLLIFTPIISVPYIIINILAAIIILKIHYHINIINIEKIKNIIKSKKIKTNLSEDERYLEKIPIKTFDGSNSATHPYIMYFDKLFHGHNYYMVHTPYDNHNIELENPSLCVSNDGINFAKPKDAKDPLLPVIKRAKNKMAKYYSDNFMLYDNNTLQVWYRYTEEDKSQKPYKLKNQIFKITSKGGIHYTKPELMLNEDGIWYLSPSIIKINNLYYLYYFDKDLKFYAKTSSDLKTWGRPHLINIKGFNGNCWHGEVKLIAGKIYLLLLSKKYQLYFCQTNENNPFVFKNCDKLLFHYHDSSNIYGDTHPYKSTFLVKDGYIDFYIPYSVNTLNYFRLNKIKHIKQVMTFTHVKIGTYNKYIKTRPDSI